MEAHAYLEQHAVLLWVQEVLRELVKEQPGSPWSFIKLRAEQEDERTQAKEPREEGQEMDRGAIETNAALLDKLMRLEAEQEERRKQLASLLENQAARQSTPEESRRQDLMQENLLRLQELRYDQMVLSEQQKLLGEPEAPRCATPDYDPTHEAAAVAHQVCDTVCEPVRDEDTDSAVSGSRSAVSAPSSESTAVEGVRPLVPKLVLPKRSESSQSSRQLDSRQRKTREALQKLTALYSVPISHSTPSLHRQPAEPAKRLVRPPLPPKERVREAAATRVRSATAGRSASTRRPEAKLQPLPRQKAYGPSLRDELKVRDELGKLLSCH